MVLTRLFLVTSYAELQCTSHFSFLRGASSCEELFAQAALYGIDALAITDRNSLAGIVRAHDAAKTTGVRLIVGCRLDLVDGSSILVYPTDKKAYGRLCRLLTLGKKRGGKAQCHLHWEDLPEYTEGMIGILVPVAPDETCIWQLAQMKKCFGKDAFLSLTRLYRPDDHMRLHLLSELADQAGIFTVATNDVLYHISTYRILQDVVTCIRLGCTIDELGFRRERTADRYLKTPDDMTYLFSRYPSAIARTTAIARRCRFSLDELSYQYPKEVCIPGLTPQQALEKLTWEGAASRYPEFVPLKVQKALYHELGLINQLNYAPYFLTVNSIVQFARSRGILCQGRGSAANSSVCYVLGITSIDPDRNDLLFERFISQERNEPPDIDVDFEHERREIVMQWVFDTYGRDRAALCSTVIRYRSRGALRDVGKALGLPEDMLKGLSSQVWAWSAEGVTTQHAEELNMNLGNRRLRLALVLARKLIGTPRHLSQHPGGFVLTHDRLDELCPIEPAAMDNRQIIEWDKDDIDILKFMKVDCLALGMLSAIKRSFDLLKDQKNIDLELATIPAEDPETYAMIRKADTLGTFQIESRAQMASLPLTRPEKYYDLVIQVAIVRPGPIQGNMVHPYLRRRHGKEPATYPTKELEKVLGKTLGVPLFQEQAMRVAIECAGFTPGEADQLRRAMATFKFTGGVSHFKEKLIKGMVSKGYTVQFAENTFSQLEGFGSYGFPESHAASFALLAYASSWLKCWHPDIFCAALLNSQPMGFYAPAELVDDAREHGVEVLPICVNKSRWDCTLEPTGKRFMAVRLGMRLARRLPNDAAASIIAARADSPYANIQDVWKRARVPAFTLKLLAKADAFLPSLSLDRREALWAVKGLQDEPLPLFAAADDRENCFIAEFPEDEIQLKPMSAGREVVEDYHNIGFTLRAHPVSFLRKSLTRQGYISCERALQSHDKRWVKVAGIVRVRQKPGSAKGVMFITIRDETGFSNLVIWPSLYEKQRSIIFTAQMLGVEGRIQREGDVVHLIATQLFDLSADLASVGNVEGAFPITAARGDEVLHGGGPDQRSLDPVIKPRDIFIPDLHIDSIKVKTRDFR